ncbi:MAG: AI-2E family transporter, partial [Steroidobacteraceae bacterium]
MIPKDIATPADINVRSVALTVIAFAATMAVLWWAREVFIPIVLSVLISYALDPLVLWLMRIRIPRAAAAAVIVGSLACTLGYTAWTLSDDAAEVVAQLPEAAQKLRQTMRRNSAGEPGAIAQMQ